MCHPVNQLLFFNVFHYHHDTVNCYKAAARSFRLCQVRTFATLNRNSAVIKIFATVAFYKYLSMGNLYKIPEI